MIPREAPFSWQVARRARGTNSAWTGHRAQTPIARPHCTDRDECGDLISIFWRCSVVEEFVPREKAHMRMSAVGADAGGVSSR